MKIELNFQRYSLNYFMQWFRDVYDPPSMNPGTPTKYKRKIKDVLNDLSRAYGESCVKDARYTAEKLGILDQLCWPMSSPIPNDFANQELPNITIQLSVDTVRLDHD